MLENFYHVCNMLIQEGKDDAHYTSITAEEIKSIEYTTSLIRNLSKLAFYCDVPCFIFLDLEGYNMLLNKQ